MTTRNPPRWTIEEINEATRLSTEVFRTERLKEPLEQYLHAFDTARESVLRLLARTDDLSRLTGSALEVLTDPKLLEAVRYLAAPPISEDDLMTLAEASLTPARLRRDPVMAKRVVETVLIALDQRRFTWITEKRNPSQAERQAAAMASAALMASRRVFTGRANEAKTLQEARVRATLGFGGLKVVLPRVIRTLGDAPAPGSFCGECLFGSRKADIVVRLWDGRAMPIECKVSNSSTNSVKRLNNDAAVKAEAWLKEFGTTGAVPSAVLSGVFKPHNVAYAQARGLVIFWAHDLQALLTFVDSSKPK